MINRVMLNETSYFGRGSRSKLADEIQKRGYRNILLVSDRVLKEVLSLVEFLDEEDVKQYKELWNNGQYKELFSELELPYYYDPEERQFWLHRNFCDRHKAYINGQRYFDTNAKLEMRRPSES